jgi:hypothetical protein
MNDCIDGGGASQAFFCLFFAEGLDLTFALQFST